VVPEEEDLTMPTVQQQSSSNRTPLRDYYSKSDKLNFESELHCVQQKIYEKQS